MTSLRGFGKLAKTSKHSETDLGPAAAFNSSLLQDPTFFVARQWLTSRIENWLKSDGLSPVLVLSGPPGSGKSRLTYALAADLANTQARRRLGALILRDLQAQRADPFSWPLLRDQLLSLANTKPAMLSHYLSGHAQVGITMPGSEVTGTKIGRLMGDLIVNGADPVRELKNLVLPALNELPAGDPILIAIDGLDEAFRSNDGDFLGVVQSLADNIALAGGKDWGIGRLRLLVTSQPEVPVCLPPALQPVVIDLAQPDITDREDLRTYVTALLNRLDENDRERIANVVSEQANGIWAIAFYVASAIADDAAAGKAPPQHFSSPSNLGQVYTDALERARGRLGLNWNTARRLLALVAAAQNIETALPTDVAAAALKIDGSALSLLLEGTRAVLNEGHDRKLRFFHGDFGRWIIDGGLGESAVFDAHCQLAEILCDLGRNNWQAAGSYCLTNVALHALAAAELSIGKVTRPRMVSRCIELFADRDRLYADTSAGNWLDQLERLSAVCSSDVRLPGSAEPLTRLTHQLASELELSVGMRLGSSFSEEQLDEFERFIDTEDDQAAKAWLDTNSPNYQKVVHEEFRNLFSDILAGRRAPHDDGASCHERAEDYNTAWDQSRKSEYLDAAVAAWQEALDLTPEGSATLTSRLLGLAIALTERIRAAEQDGDLDRVLDVRAELLRRDDLADHARDPGFSWAVYASLLRRRWERDPSGHPGDLDAAVEAWQEALDHAPGDHPERTTRLLGLANGLIARGNAAEQDTDLDGPIDAQAELVRRDDLADHVRDPGRPWAVYASLLYRRWKREPAGHPGDLDAAVEAWQEALDRAPGDHPERTRRLLGLADGLIAREQDTDLDRLIDAQAELVRRDDLADHARDPGRPWEVYASLLRRRSEHDPSGHPGDLDAAVEAWQEALDRAPEDHPERTTRLLGLANGLIARGNAAEQDTDLDRLIDAQAELVRRDDLADHVRDPGAPWAVYASLLDRRSRRRAGPWKADQHLAVETWQEALDRTPEDHAERTRRLLGLANGLIARIEAAEQDADFDRLVDAQAELVRRDDLADHVRDPGRPWAVYGSGLRRRWERDPSGHPGDLDETITAWQQCLDRTPENHPERTLRMAEYANAHLLGYLNGSEIADLDCAINEAAAVLKGSHTSQQENLLPALRRLGRLQP
jgi:tetratricopeptide (TPR) repeat protein/DNA polymerase III delta prime subunit